MDLSPFEMGVLRSKMTEGSAAVVLGRSARWVTRQRAALAEDAGAGSEAESQANPQPSAPAAGVPEYEVMAEGPMVVVQVALQPTPAELARVLGQPGQTFMSAESGFPKPAPPVKWAPEIPPRVVRWATWFVDARWQTKTVAELFDVPEPALRSALDLARKAGQAA
jgi:hypothetical protein